MKITLEQQEKGKELYQDLVQKAWKNATFKEQLIENPEGVIAEFTGVTSKLSGDTKIVVEDQTAANTIYLNIPRNVDLENFELTEEQLESISGGTDPITAAVITAAVAICALLGGAYSLGYSHGKDAAAQ